MSQANDDDLMRVTWLMREEGLRLRKPEYILETFWVPLLIPPILLLAHDAPRKAALSGATAYLAYVLYAAVAYLYWRRRYLSRTMFRDRGTVVIVQGYYGLGLLFFSITMLAGSLLSIRRVPALATTGSLLLLAMYAATYLVVAIRGKAILRWIADHMNRPLAPEMRWMLGIPNVIIGVATALGAVSLHVPVGWAVSSVVAAVGAFLAAPFAALTLYQIPLFLVWRGGPAERP